MTNQEIMAIIGVTTQISGDVAPSRKEQRDSAKTELEGSNPQNLEALYKALKSKGFGVGFSQKLYKSGDSYVTNKGMMVHKFLKGEEESMLIGILTEGAEYLPITAKTPEEKEVFHATNGEDNFTHAKIMFSYVQNMAIRYKLASLELDSDSKSKAKKDAYTEARNKFYTALVSLKDEMGIVTKCKASDAESISTFAAKFTYKTAYITDGIKYAPAGLNTFANNVMKYLAAESEGMETSIEALARRQARLSK